MPGRIDIFIPARLAYLWSDFRRRGSSSVLGLSAYDIEPQGSITDERVDDLNATETLTNLARFEETLDDGRLGATYIDRLWLSDGEMRGYNGVVGFDGSYRPNREWSMQWEFPRQLTLAWRMPAPSSAGQIAFSFSTTMVIIAGSQSMSISRRSFRAEAGFIPRLGYHQVATKFDLYFRDVGGMNFGSPGFYISSYLDESGKAIEHFAGVGLYPLGGSPLTFTKYEIRPELIETSEEWLLPQRLDLAIGSQVMLNLNTRSSSAPALSEMKISLMGASRSLVGRLIMKQVSRRDLCPPFFLEGSAGRALFDEQNELLGEDLILTAAWVSGI